MTELIKNFLRLTFLMTLCLSTGAVALAGDEEYESEKSHKAIAATPNVVVSLCVASGKISVRGSAKNEVSVTTSEDFRIEFRQAGGSSNDTAPASRLEIAFSEKDALVGMGECFADTDAELVVPRGAVVQLKTREGDIEVNDVGEARLDTLSGNLTVRHVAKGVEASSLGGDISVKDVVGSVHLKALSGNIEASELRSAETGNDLEARAVSGDIYLEKVEYQRIEANTVSGDVNVEFSPAKTGRYNVKTTSGDISLTMPVDSSFQITAKVKRGDIVNDFPLKQAASDQKLTDRLEGVSGAGDAIITLYSFSGTVSLRHK